MRELMGLSLLTEQDNENPKDQYDNEYYIKPESNNEYYIWVSSPKLQADGDVTQQFANYPTILGDIKGGDNYYATEEETRKKMNEMLSRIKMKADSGFHQWMTS